MVCRIFLFILLCLVVSTPAFSGDVYQVTNATAKICILKYETPFKNDLAKALAEDYNSEGFDVFVDTVSNGTQYNAADYDAVILLSATQAFSPLPKTADYIKKNNYAQNIVYVSTYAKFNIPYGMSLDKKKIDAITSASLEKGSAEFDGIKAKIKEKSAVLINK